MIRSLNNICLLLVISLAMGAIWPDCSAAVQAPQLELLGEVKSGLRVPTRIDVDNSGNLFVADSRLQQIFKFDKYGTELLVVDQEKTSGAGLAVSPAGDRIYASAFDKVVVFDGAGELIGYVGQGAGEFTAAGSIDLDSDGNIYVADLGTGTIKQYAADGSAAGQFGAVTFVANYAFVIHPETGSFYLPDSVFHTRGGLRPQLTVFDSNANQLQQIQADNGFGADPLLFFGGMAFDSQERTYITDMEGKTIRVLDAAGTWLATYDRNGELSRPGSMAFDVVTNRLFVVQADNKIDIYGIDGAENPVAVNNPPETPIPVSPIGGSEVAFALPSLNFNNSVDADESDELSYTVRVFAADNTLVTSLTVAEQAATTSVVLDVDLQENDFYRWQVQAFDGQAESDWSELQGFYINAVQEAPSVPVLVAPLAGSAAKTDALLEWQVATDADPFDTVSYLLEVSASADFSEILYSEELAATERQLTDWSGQIEPGQVYHWQITAVDNHGLKTSSNADGSFIYQASLLNVAANMPGTRVYLGGNQGYAGQFIGEAPCKLRDLPEGRYSLILERAGFEPFFQPIDIQENAPTEVYVELRPALLPGKQSFSPLKVAGTKIKAGSLLTPLIADLDLDGIEDLLLSYADGRLHYHPGVLSKKKGKAKARKVRFTAEKQLSLPQMAGGTPVLVDWNNDYQQDLLIGTADGSVWLHLNQGDFSFTEEPIWLAAVGSSAVPAVADIDADGNKDLVVGSGDGELVLFSNLGSDAEVQLSEPQLLTAFAEAAAPTFADWNGDGQRELLIAAEGQIYQAVYSAGALAEMKQVSVKGGTSIARLFAHDVDVISGKNLIVGTANGRLLLSQGRRDGNKRYVADYYRAIEEKLKQLEMALEEDNTELLPLMEPLYVKLAQQKMNRLAKQAKKLVAELPANSDAASVANELANILLY